MSSSSTNTHDPQSAKRCHHLELRSRQSTRPVPKGPAASCSLSHGRNEPLGAAPSGLCSASRNFGSCVGWSAHFLISLTTFLLKYSNQITTTGHQGPGRTATRPASGDKAGPFEGPRGAVGVSSYLVIELVSAGTGLSPCNSAASRGQGPMGLDLPVGLAPGRRPPAAAPCPRRPAHSLM